jgi:hypothetical protein
MHVQTAAEFAADLFQLADREKAKTHIEVQAYRASLSHASQQRMKFQPPGLVMIAALSWRPTPCPRNSDLT